MMGAVIISLGAGIGLGIFAALLVTAGVGGLIIRNKIREFSKGVFGTESLVEGINKQSETLAITPKSVNSMTRLMEPLIMKDFPDFVWNQFAKKAESMLKSALVAITDEDVTKLVEASDEVKSQVRTCIEQNRAQGLREYFKDIRIHQTEIANYQKLRGKCVITIQMSIEYFHYKLEDGHLVWGYKDRKQQARYNVELVYVQDADKAGSETARGTTCPNCGAPIKNLGHPVCEYCGMGVEIINIKVWKLNSFKED